MAERVVSLRITAEVNSFLKGVDEVARKTREGSSELDKMREKLEAQKKAFNVVGTAMLAAGGVIAAGLVLATKRAAEFDTAMSAVQAATHETAGNMSLLRDAALDAGAETVYSAKEAAGAIEELAKAGLSTQSIIGGGLTGALDLAAAGGLDVADAAGIASTTLQQFKLSGDQASHVADVLAAGAGKAMGDVSDLSMALSQSGTVAAQFGLSLEETTGSLAAFASKGLLGSDAGTAFRSMLLRLANPTGEAAAKMKELGIQAYDAQGNFVGMTGLAGQLEKGLSGLTQEQRNAALAIIFGQDAIRAANVLYSEGAEGIAKWTKEVDDAGYAGETAAARLDNLNGDLEKLSGAFDTALITIGGAGQGPLRAVVQGITELVDGFNGMPEGGQVAVYWVGAVTAAVALAGGTALVAIPKFAALKVGLQELGVSGERVSKAMSGLATVGKIAGGVATAATVLAVLPGIIDQINESLYKYSDITRNLTAKNASLSESFDSLVKNGSKWSDVTKNTGDVLDRLGDLDQFVTYVTALDDTGRAAVGLSSALKTLSPALAGMPLAQSTAQFQGYARELDASDSQMLNMIENMPEFKAQLVQAANAQNLAATDANLLAIATGKAESATKSASDAYLEQADAANGVRDALKQLYDQMNAGNSAQQTAIQANADFVQGLSEIAAKAAESGTSLDESTAAGSANASMLAGLAGDAQAAAQAQYEVDRTTMSAKDAADKYAATLANQRQKFIDSAVQAGYNADEVQKLADKVFALPSEKAINILAETGRAKSQIDQLVWENDGRRITLNVDTNVTTLKVPGGLTGSSYAVGGAVTGPGGPTEDRVPALLSNGEHVLTAAEVRRAGGHGAIYAMRAAIMSGAPRYAAGGPVYAQNFTFAGLPSVGSQVTIRQDIHPSQRMSESELARIVAEKTQFAVRGA